MGGFILSLVSVLGYFIVAAIATGQAAVSRGGATTMIFWCTICTLALLLSLMGYRRSSATGSKAGLALAGMIISIGALLLSVWSFIDIRSAANNRDVENVKQELMDGFNLEIDKLKKQMNEQEQNPDQQLDSL